MRWISQASQTDGQHEGAQPQSHQQQKQRRGSSVGGQLRGRWGIERTCVLRPDMAGHMLRSARRGNLASRVRTSFCCSTRPAFCASASRSDLIFFCGGGRSG
jgi:hypothetical protein